ncbi:protein-glutamate O-methyltransferase CheR [Corallococcus sp. M34]|uniref:CheR family methyltransferase n=1 Tax=Citreicoccus inhibens TaxID=2849499 RepID=UPI001C245DCE|nr:protein-glutamate O-methyltransferase CheR [Citreicoccus inhibens]MBU8897947.1 protein-glutamate O-methyltransferase CheR [Citreicoccus inhibens]
MSVGPPLHPDYAAVLDLVEERAGLAPPSCPAAAEEGIQRALARTGLTDLVVYRQRLEEDPAALDDLLGELTVGETYFFRTPEHYEYLRRVVLPDLRERWGPEHTARFWSAACASGEEAYSMAVLLMTEGWAEHMSVYATDISRVALARARLARYGEWSLRGPAAERMRPYLSHEARAFTLSADVRRHVRLAYLNLAVDTWPSPGSDVWRLDVIFCRNVFIYFNRPTVEAVARRLHDSLAEGGYLFTGPSDPPLSNIVPLEPVLTDWGVLYRRPLARAALPRTAPEAPTPPPEIPAYVPPRAPVLAPSLPPVPPPPEEPSPPRLDADALASARRALERGDWREAARRTGALDEDPTRAMLAVRTLANLNPQSALYACGEAIRRHPLTSGLRYQEALLLLGEGRLADAERSARQALYLEPGLAVAQLLLGHVLRQEGDTAAAARAYGEAEALCRRLPPDSPVPLGEGERAGRLADVARAERRRLTPDSDGGTG